MNLYRLEWLAKVLFSLLIYQHHDMTIKSEDVLWILFLYPLIKLILMISNGLCEENKKGNNNTWAEWDSMRQSLFRQIFDIKKLSKIWRTN
jgi:hypothetical protein